MNRFKLNLLYFSALGALLVGGCAVDVDPSSRHEVAAEEGDTNTIVVQAEDIELARVELESGQVIGWYEPVPGVVVLGGNVVKGGNPFDYIDKTLSIEEQYQALVPGREVPQTLVLAAERNREMRRAIDEGRLEPLPRPVVSKTPVDQASDRDGTLGGAESGGVRSLEQAAVNDSACAWSWFEPTYCGICSAPDHNKCGDWKVRWSFRTNTSYFQKDDTWWARTAMCSYRGAVRYRVKWRTWWSWETSVDVIRQTGEGWWWSHMQFDDFDVESRVDDASGDGYHHCGTGNY